MDIKDLTRSTIVLDHGTGAKLSRELVEMIVSVLGDTYIGEMEDSALLDAGAARLAMTTDSFVVDPPLFGNGDIGKIAVCGTVNDLAVVGATPKYLSLALILEAGLPFSTLVRVLESIRDTAREANVKIVAGDTKVVGKGEADQIFINTTGIGAMHRAPLRMKSVRPGDRVILSGQIGSHTIHLLSIREGLGFETRVLSDCAPLNGMLAALFAAVPEEAVRSVRDVTRGGLSAVMHEYASKLDTTIEIREADLPIQAETVMAADMLGVDPINMANEGCLCLFVAPEHAGRVLDVLRTQPYGEHAVEIGSVLDTGEKAVVMRTKSGATRTIEELAGAELPRLC
ncbi:Carbamoyl dehydratase HypE [Burkholderia multivorans]